MMKSVYICIVLLLSPMARLGAQETIPYNQQAEIYFIQALTNFEQQNFIAAAMMFQQVEKDFPLHQRTTAAIIMEAKSLFHLERYDSSIQVLGGFLRRFPNSSYVDDARFTLAQNYYIQRRYRDIVPEMLSIIESSDDSVLIDHAEDLLTTTGVFHLPMDEINDLTSQARNQPAIVVTGKILAQKYALEGEFTKASEVIRHHHQTIST